MSEGKTSPWVWVGIGCGVLFVGAVAFVAFIVFVVFASMRSSTPYKDGLARAQADVRVIEVLGAPVEPGMFVSGNIHTSGPSGTVDIDIPLKGSKQNGSLHVVGTKEGGRWTYTRMIMTPDRGEPIDLLGESRSDLGVLRRLVAALVRSRADRADTKAAAPAHPPASPPHS
jgi:hypothetical protein